MSTRYNSNVVIQQASGRQSGYSAPRSSSSTTYSSSYAQSTFSMDSSSASRSTTEARYRSGSSAGYYTDVKELKGSRGGPNLVVVKHDRGNPDRDEPRSYSGGSYSKTAKNRS